MKRLRAWAVDQGPIGCLAWSLLVVAAAASFDHWHRWATGHGQTGAAAVSIALLPDLLTWAALQKLRTEHLGGLGGSVVAAVLLSTAYATLAVNYSTAKAPTGGAVGDGERLAAMAPVIGAILATLLAEIRGPRRHRATAVAAAAAPALLAAANTTRVEVTEQIPDDVPGGDRTDEQLLAEARRKIAAGVLDAVPSGAQLRKHLGVGADRARRIRDQLIPQEA